jgi:WD40 repeat protein
LVSSHKKGFLVGSLRESPQLVRSSGIGRGARLCAQKRLKVGEIKGFKEKVRWFEFLPDGKTLLIADADTIKLWDIASQKEIYSSNYEGTFGITAITLTPDGKFLVTAHLDGSIKKWEIK